LLALSLSGFDPLTDLGSSPCHTVVDLAAKRNKVDGFCQERLGTALQGLSPGTVVAVGGDALAFGKSSRPVIPGMLMSERIRINDAPDGRALRWRRSTANPTRTGGLLRLRKGRAVRDIDSRFSELVRVPRVCGKLFGFPSWTGNEPKSRNPSGVPILDSFTAHGALKATDLARLHHVLATVINRAVHRSWSCSEPKATRLLRALARYR
jgi:hypothetical protein